MTDYGILLKEAQALGETETHYVPLLSNISALLFEQLGDLNWAGFYLMDRGSLVVGPFQGKTACIRIEIGKGVCGTAAERKEAVRVPDVHKFPGHIACDSASNSELVVPIFSDGELVGVLDMDSPSLDRFTADDEEGIKKLAELIGSMGDFSGLRR